MRRRSTSRGGSGLVLVCLMSQAAWAGPPYPVEQLRQMPRYQLWYSGRRSLTPLGQALVDYSRFPNDYERYARDPSSGFPALQRFSKTRTWALCHLEGDIKLIQRLIQDATPTPEGGWFGPPKPRLVYFSQHLEKNDELLPGVLLPSPKTVVEDAAFLRTVDHPPPPMVNRNSYALWRIYLPRHVRALDLGAFTKGSGIPLGSGFEDVVLLGQNQPLLPFKVTWVTRQQVVVSAVAGGFMPKGYRVKEREVVADLVRISLLERWGKSLLRRGARPMRNPNSW